MRAVLPALAVLAILAGCADRPGPAPAGAAGGSSPAQQSSATPSDGSATPSDGSATPSVGSATPSVGSATPSVGSATGPESGGAGPDGGTDGGDAARAGDTLLVRVDPGGGAPVEEYTLTCGGTAEGTLPDAPAACAHLADAERPFAPVPADAFCTQQYGGPQTARITGRWRGGPADLALSRVDGCRIAQWDALGPLLPGDVGTPVPPRPGTRPADPPVD